MANEQLTAPPPPQQVTLASFLESIPRGTAALLNAAVGDEFIDVTDRNNSRRMRTLEKTEIHLHCSSDRCGGIRVFQVGPGALKINRATNLFISVVCRNCLSSPKTFAVRFDDIDEFGQVTATKIGEWPPFGPPTPARVITLIGPDRDLFLRGKRAENQGLGIGAFAYYRRVVENQKSRLITKIGEVAKVLGAMPPS